MKLRRTPYPATPLDRSPLADRIPKIELQKLHFIGTQVTLHTGQTIMRESTVGRECIVLLDGEVEVNRGGLQVASLGAGDFAGELALITGQPRNATVTVTTPAAAYAFTRREFTSLLDTCPQLSRHLLRSAARRLAAP